MDFDYQLYKLTSKFMSDYPISSYPEILSKPDRPHYCLLIDTHCDYFICVPFRSNIGHNNAYLFKGTKRSKRSRSGLDYSKIAIIKDNYKYSYDKETGKEFLYDLAFDKEENHNLVYTEFYDVDRYLWYSTSQCFYYPYWDEAVNILEKFRKIKQEMWEKGTIWEEFYNRLLQRIKCCYLRIKLSKPNDNIKNTGK